jgi:hypothetical protein
MRGTLAHEATTQPSVHLLSLYEVSTGIVLAQRAVQTKENEISAVPDLLLPVLIKGRIWSADAMHTRDVDVCTTHAERGRLPVDR